MNDIISRITSKAWVLILFLFLFSCKAKQTAQIEVQEKNIRKEIPLTSRGEPNFFYRLSKYQASKLQLDSLETGYDSLQIRIWCNYGLFDITNVIIIKRNDEKWSAELLTLHFDENDSSMRTPILKERISRTPVSGWPSFIKGLLNFNIIILPDQRHIPGYNQKIAADGVTYNIEVATNESYRFYSYWAPDNYKSQFKEAMYLESAMEFLENELSFKRLIR